MASLVATGPDSWVWWDWVARHTDEIARLTREHVELTVVAVGIGFAVALPVAVAGSRWKPLAAPTLFVAGVIYTIPSLALFAVLIPWTGLSFTTAQIGLVGYTLLILIRNTLAGLDGVPDDVRDAARGMGFSRSAQLVRVDLPLALPAIVAGLRIATVTTVGLVTITALIGRGGLGELIYDGLIRDFRTPLVVGSVLSVALAAVADLLLLLVLRALTPWSRARA